MMSKKTVIQVIVVVLVLVNTIVLALLWFKKDVPQQPAPGGSARDYLVKELSLNQKQVKDFEELRQDHFAGIQGLRRQERELKEQLFENVSIESGDTLAVNTLLQKIGEVTMQRDRLTLEHFRQVRTLLGAQQKKQFDDIITDVIRIMNRPSGPPPGKEGKGRNMPPRGDHPPNGERPGGHRPVEGDRPPDGEHPPHDGP